MKPFFKKFKLTNKERTVIGLKEKSRIITIKNMEPVLKLFQGQLIKK